MAWELATEMRGKYKIEMSLVIWRRTGVEFGKVFRKNEKKEREENRRVNVGVFLVL